MKTAKVFGIGPDGRKCYTADPDAHAGHCSSTASRSAGPYVGYDLHLAVQTRDVRWTNHIDKTTLGTEVPGVITTCNLVPAGTHHGDAIVAALIASKKTVCDINDVIWDPGYSLCLPGTTSYPLAQAGIDQTLQMVTHQRGIRPFAGDALLLDGQLSRDYCPLSSGIWQHRPASPGVHIDVPTRRSSTDEPDGDCPSQLPRLDGVTRWRCPFCAGLLRSRQFPRTMRRSRQAPMVEVPEGVTQRFSGSVGAPGRAAHHPEDPVRHHGLAGHEVPASSGRVRQLGGQGSIRRSVSGILPGVWADEAFGAARVHLRRVQPRPHSQFPGQADRR